MYSRSHSVRSTVTVRLVSSWTSRPGGSAAHPVNHPCLAFNKVAAAAIAYVLNGHVCLGLTLTSAGAGQHCQIRVRSRSWDRERTPQLPGAPPSGVDRWRAGLVCAAIHTVLSELSGHANRLCRTAAQVRAESPSRWWPVRLLARRELCLATTC